MKKVTEVPDLLQQWQASSGVDLSEDQAAVTAAYEQARAQQRNIFIKILAIAGGLLAAAFFLGFLYVARLAESSGALLSIGILLYATSLTVSKRFATLILDTLSVTAFVLSLLLIGVGLGNYQLESHQIFAILALLGLLTLPITDHYLLVFLAVLVFTGSLFFIVPDDSLHLVQPCLIALLAWAFALWGNKEADIVKHKKFGRLYHPVRLGLICTLLVSSVSLRWVVWNHPPGWVVPMASLLIMGALLYSTVPVLKRLGITDSRRIATIMVGITLLLLPALFAPSIPCCLLVLLLCFSIRDNTGFVLGIAGLVYVISRFYYDLQFSLLTKSMLLILPGLLFLVLYYLLHQSYKQDEKI